MSNQNQNRRFGGRGYYIALILCACAIGISGYVYYSGSSKPAPLDQPVLATEETPVSVHRPTQKPRPVSPAEPAATEPQKLSVCAPAEGEIVAAYAVECLSYNETTRDWRTHSGIDIAADAGTEVVAAADGEVYTVYSDDRMGTTVVIRHAGGFTTKYASLSPETKVVPGQAVRMGQAIGTVGTSALLESALGDHVHFSVTHNDAPVNPEDFIAGKL